MGVRNWNLWRASIFQQAKLATSPPQTAQKCLHRSQSGELSMQYRPVSHAGYCDAHGKDQYQSWLVLGPLLFKVRNPDGSFQDEKVLITTSRSYIPLDPNESMTNKEKDSLASIKSIAKTRHAIERAQAGKVDNYKDMAEFVITWCLVLDALGLLSKMVVAWITK